ncbi:MAG: LamB/YcsF family protein [Sandaracinaceae bacterium]|nr:LamB/YcsF family protein [Sandaracinaceae bacterium]
MTLLNLDAGEHDAESEALLRCADALNIACGGHAGDDASMTRCLRACRAYAIRAGAHPSYPDRAGFGRTSMPIEPEALRASILTQCHALLACARSLGVSLAHAKLHGALYHDANRDPALAALVLGAVREALGPVIVVGPPRGEQRQFCLREGLPFEREGFADRALRSDGSLVPRGEPGALVSDPAFAAAQALRLAREGHDTICVHGDGEHALALARAVREALGSR